MVEISRILAIVVFLSLISLGAGPVAHDARELEELVDKLRKVTPAGWKVSVVQSEKGDLDIEVWREKKVQFYPFTPLNSAPPSPGEPETPNPPKTFEFNFHLFPYLSPEEFDRLQKENDKIKAKLAQFTKELLDVPRHGKARAFGENDSLSYFPRNDKEKARVAEMAKYEKANPLHRLPHDYYFGRMSFGFYDPRISTGLKSKQVDKECSKTLELILKIFSSYEDE